MGRNAMEARSRALSMSSGVEMNEQTELSLRRIMRLFRSGGSTMRTACGMIMWRYALNGVIPLFVNILKPAQENPKATVFIESVI